MKPTIPDGAAPLGADAEELAAIISHSPIEFYIIEPDTLRYLYVNETACRNSGYSPEELLAMDVYDLNPEMTPARIAEMKKNVNTDEAIYNVSVHRRKDGTRYYVHAHIYAMTFRGEPVYVVFDTDITEQRRLEQLAAERGEIIDKATNEIYILDYETNRYLYANQGACTNLGYTCEELLKMDVYDINPDLTYEQTVALKKAAEGRSFITNTSRHRRRDGSFYPVHAMIQHIVYQGKNAYMIIDTDITEIEAAREALRRQAFYDPLTGLPNRQLFYDRLEMALNKAKRGGREVAVLFIDYDHFKQINDTFGHDIGDRVLRRLAQRLREHLRTGDTLARLGGDEFLVLFESLDGMEEAMGLVRRLTEAEREPVRVGEQEFRLSCSVGCAFYPRDGREAETLIRHADMAMYHAKQTGRNRFRCYSSVLGSRADARMELLSELRQAFENREFFLMYQPQVYPAGRRIAGFEALLRWRRPDGGITPAAEFIDYAAGSGILVALGRDVMEQAFEQMRAWDRQGIDYGRVAVNLSMLQLADPELPEQISELMERYGIRPQRLEFEITESEIMLHPAETVGVLQRISALGVSLAVDDFGTGHSSLAYLKRFPVQRLKIDREFIASLPHNKEDASIVQMVAALAEALGLEVVAEGVEEEAQLAFVEAAGCAVVQGFYFSRALHAHAVADYLAALSKNQ